MKSSEMLQRLILAKEAGDLEPLINQVASRNSTTFDIAAVTTLCVHPLLTMQQARLLFLRNNALLPILAENASLRLQLQTDPEVLSVSGQAFRDMETLLQAVPAEAPPLPALHVARDVANNVLSAGGYLLEEGNRLTKEETNLLARIILVVLLGTHGYKWATYEYTLASAANLIKSLPKDTWRSDFLSRLVGSCLAKALVRGNQAVVSESYELYVQVVGGPPDRTEPFLVCLLHRLIEGGEIGVFASASVPSFVDPQVIDRLRAAVVQSLMRKDPPMLEECPLAVWALTTSGVAGLLRSLAAQEHVSDERIRALLAIAGARGEFRGHDPLPNPISGGACCWACQTIWVSRVARLASARRRHLERQLPRGHPVRGAHELYSESVLSAAHRPFPHTRPQREELWIHKNLF